MNQAKVHLTLFLRFHLRQKPDSNENKLKNLIHKINSNMGEFSENQSLWTHTVVFIKLVSWYPNCTVQNVQVGSNIFGFGTIIPKGKRLGKRDSR